MSKLKGLKPERVFHYFEEISNIPRGSGNMKGISDYCLDFAISQSLKYYRDDANNVIIKKPASKGYEDKAPIILQGHLDIVCQKTAESNKDFLKDGLDLLIDGDFIKADGTTLGADNGIAVAMVLAILEDNTISHPAIEAVFTTDEEIGMIGAGKLDFGLLKGKRMINLDSEEEDVLTVSCAGGSDFEAILPVKRENFNGYKVEIILKGLKGGHSGVEIHKGRVNADILAGRIVNRLKAVCDFSLIAINGGDKSNVITNQCSIEFCTKTPEILVSEAEKYLALISAEIKERESGCAPEIRCLTEGNYSVLDKKSENDLIFSLTCVPNGVITMSAEIEGLVETSLNLGILKTEEDSVILHHALRSNKSSALEFLEEKLKRFYSFSDIKYNKFGHYPPWEFKENSALQSIYKKVYKDVTGKEIKVEAIHAGLECGIFSAGIPGIDCIAIGPELSDVHTVNETLSIPSTAVIYEILLKILAELQ